MALNSTSVIKIVDLICEGPIQALVGARRGVFLDETPLQTDNTNNFSNADVSYDFILGGRNQLPPDEGKNTASNIVDIGVEVGENYSEQLTANNLVKSRNYGGGQIIRQITDLETDSFECLFTIPRLFSTAAEGLAKGQLFDGQIKIEVWVQSQGKAFNKQFTKTVTGISTENYQVKTPAIKLTGTGPWNIKVKKINLGEDHFEVKFANFTEINKKTSLASGRGNQLLWTSLIEIQKLKVRYSFSALAGLSISTQQFSGLPTRAYLIKGRTVKVPENAAVRKDGSLSFHGSFDGTLKTRWTTCPVCCWYDMVTNKRYGAGDFISQSNLSWVDLYPLARYANQLVTNPDGSKEPRFACNVIIGSKAQAFNVLQDLASVFRGMMYWQSNTIQATADHGNLDGSDIAPVHLYSNSNVVDGVFNYSGTSLTTRSTSIRVRYNDPDNFYKSNVVCIEDATLISKYGYQEKEIVAFGCTSRFQAARLGRYMMAAEEIDGEIVTFATGLDGAVVLPGQVFAVADELRAGVRLSGRVSSATTSVITADQSISLPAGSNHKLTVVLKDGSVETKAISSVSGADITLSSSLSSAPAAQAIWSIQSSDVVEQKFRCLTVIEKGDGQFSITGAEHNDSIYKAADKGKDLQFDDITTFDSKPTQPINLKLVAKEIKKNKTTLNRVVASWSRGLNGASISFEVRYKKGNGNYKVDTTTDINYEIDNLKPGSSLQFQVRAVGPEPLNKKSKYTTATINIPAADVDPAPDEPGNIEIKVPNPIDVTITAHEDQAILQWDLPADTQDPEELTAIIRHSSKTDGTGTWQGSTKLTEVKAVTKYAVVSLLEGEYMIKFKNQDGKKSPAEVSALIDLPDALPRLDLTVRREDQDSPPFQGDKSNVFYSEEYDALVLDGKEEWDNIVDLDAYTADIDFVGDLEASGQYVFRDVLDLGGKFGVVFNRILTARGFYPSELIDNRNELLDRWTDWDGSIADDTNAVLYFRTSDQATTDEFLITEDDDFLLLEDGDKFQMESDIDFSEWRVFETGRHTARQFQFKCELTSDHTDQSPLVDELGYRIQFERRTESSSANIDSGAGAKAVTFDKAFYQAPSVGITAFNMASGDYYEVTSVTRTGFTVTFKNSSDAAIDRTFQYQATGFGSEET